MDQLTYKSTNSVHDRAKKIMTDYLKNTIPPGIYQIKVVKVYDGDTIWGALILPNGDAVRINIRFTKINTPEIRTTDPNEKKKAIEARDFVSTLILGEVVRVNIVGLGSFHRYLGTIYPTPAQWSKFMTPGQYNKYLETVPHLDRHMELNEYLLVGGFAELYKKK